ncbi:MAG: zinc ribbon domain-containing protein [Dehalococcoidia bacterium]|nr:zinc ribbon domain-containing protein [Dehalococcoidia bacterium]
MVIGRGRGGASGGAGGGAPPQDIQACPNCGARVQAEWVFCGSCGQSAVGTLPFAESAGMPGGATNRRILQAGLAAGLVALVAAGGRGRASAPSPSPSATKRGSTTNSCPRLSSPTAS